jgi:signal transduction histidine kinase
MLVEILLVVVVLVVGILIAVDVSRTPRETPDELTGGQPQDAGWEDVHAARGAGTAPGPASTGIAAAPDSGPSRHRSGGQDQSSSGRKRAAPAPDAARKNSRRALRNWRVRSRLLLLVIIPTITAVVFGGIQIASSLQSASIHSPVSSVRDRAITSVIFDCAVVLLVLALALAFTVIVGRSMVQPLRTLRAEALEVAEVRLPEAVRRISETDGEDVLLDVEPIDVDSSDEIGQVARAFDQVHQEALRLAANEAALRGNVNAMFVNLSRRSQSLVERQIRLIDDLEQGEQDAERLANLFKMDHLATRMRRNSENLLVLAGHDLSSRWNQPVALVDVLRAALSEIEEYERVSLNMQPGIAVRGPAVNDVVHLLAELAENATSLSSADTPVNISGHLLNSGGVLVDITDQGVGMGAEEMAHANWRLDNPPVVDVAVSRRMGLFVVGRLAARHGIRVRLRPAASGGLTALVWLPDEVITNEEPAATPGFGGFGTLKSGPGQLEVELAGLAHADWPDPDRANAEQEVNAARTPKFAPLVNAQDSPLGPRRVPGAGLRPGQEWPDSGAQPVFPPESAEFGGWPSDPGPPSEAIGQETASVGQGAEAASQEPESVDGESLAADPEFAASYEQGGWDTGPSEPTGGSGAQPILGGGDGAFGGDAAFGTGPRSTTGPSVTGSSITGSSITGSSITGSSITGGNEAELADAPLGASAPFTWEMAPANGEVIVPPAESLVEEHRLPIFEAVESDWFRHGRNAFGWSGDAEEPEPSWASPADEGWRAAETVSTPSTAGLTSAGLPKRVPQANLVPGAAASARTQTPVRSAAATRERFASFQRGVREGRAAASTGATSPGQDETS